MTATKPEPDRRHFSRVQFQAAAKLSQSDHQAEVNVVDISLQGVLIEAFDNAGLDLSKPLQLTLSLADNAVIEMDVHCVHQSNDSHIIDVTKTDDGDRVSANDQPKKYGFCCDRIDMDSITHLRRLVELNLGCSDLLNRDLSEMLSSH